jgi:hypothetical protein
MLITLGSIRAFALGLFRKGDFGSLVVVLKVVISWGMAHCCLIHGYRRFGGVYCSHLQGRILLKCAWFKRFTILKAVSYSIFRC